VSDQLQIRVHGDAARPTIVYLPGLHGDWTLIGRFREALGDRARFVEITYPRTLTWSLDDYAAGIESALADNGIDQGWLLAESFGSQVVWPIVARRKFRAQGVILAGGFVQHPIRGILRLAELVGGGICLALLVRIIFGYGKIARYRYRESPAALARLEEFLARRTKLDCRAAKHRLCLIGRNDPSTAARLAHIPVYALTGLYDPVVPWFGVRRWMRKNCANLREYVIVRHADHNVLSTGAQVAADHVMDWIAREKPPAIAT
jgi:pimeloyl-ACP methyl ester carboxylesterase